VKLVFQSLLYPFNPLRMSFQYHSDGVHCLAVDGDVIVSGSFDKTVKVWSISSGNCCRH